MSNSSRMNDPTTFAHLGHLFWLVFFSRKCCRVRGGMNCIYVPTLCVSVSVPLKLGVSRRGFHVNLRVEWYRTWYFVHAIFCPTSSVNGSSGSRQVSVSTVAIRWALTLLSKLRISRQTIERCLRPGSLSLPSKVSIWNGPLCSKVGPIIRLFLDTFFACSIFHDSE